MILPRSSSGAFAPFSRRVGRCRMIVVHEQSWLGVADTLPLVSVERALAGIPSLAVDNRQAMYEAVSHLIENHGYRRIAFIPGSEGHLGAQERYVDKCDESEEIRHLRDGNIEHCLRLRHNAVYLTIA